MLQNVLVNMLINLILVVGLYIFVGNSGVFSFGHIGFMAIGAYTAGLLRDPRVDEAGACCSCRAGSSSAHVSRARGRR